MTDDTPKNTRQMSPEEYRAAVEQLHSDARKAEGEAEQQRIMREVAAKYSTKDTAK